MGRPRTGLLLLQRADSTSTDRCGRGSVGRGGAGSLSSWHRGGRRRGRRR
uniref:Uncharacterized protein n=1 Tax=Anopheles atroparvus TaxID=41427 RepID=A0AAG5CX17_ANOAO